MALGVRASFPRIPVRSVARGYMHQQHCNPYHYSSYTHPKLEIANQIRLLKLRRGSLGSPIKCSFMYRDLTASGPRYNAISYTWGDGSPKHKIEFENNELDVTENVKTLLEHLRHPGEDKVIWIDGICINQNNEEEKSQQIQIMGQIYSLAESVYIWLGEEKEDSALLEEFVPRLADWFWTARPMQLSSDEILFQETKTERTSPEWTALKRLFERPWFNRTWVVQEFVLLVLVATELCYLYRNGNSFVQHYGFDFAVINKFLRMARIRESLMKGEYKNLSYLTYSFWTSRTSDPKDKIFSLLSLDNKIGTRLQPDYRDSVETVYIKATQESLLQGSTGILSLAGVGHHRVRKSLPSWVPDFSTTETPAPPFTFHSYNDWAPRGWESYNIYIFPETLTPFQFEGRRFTLDSIKFDTIQNLGAMLSIENGESLNEWVNEAEALFLASGYFFRKGPSSWEAHWRSLIADRVYEHSSYVRAYPIYGSYYDSLRQQLGTKATNNKVPAQERLQRVQQLSTDCRRFPLETSLLHVLKRYTHWRHPLEVEAIAVGQVTPEMCARRFAAALWQSAHGRKYCVTGKGDVALVPRYAVVGDTVCMLAGLDVPFVIRPVSREGNVSNSYKLVGECYVHGIMQGSRQDLGDFGRITLV